MKNRRRLLTIAAACLAALLLIYAGFRFHEAREGRRLALLAFEAIQRTSGATTKLGFDERMLEAKKELDEAGHHSVDADTLVVLLIYQNAVERNRESPKPPHLQSAIITIKQVTVCSTEAGVLVGAYAKDSMDTLRIRRGDCEALDHEYMEAFIKEARNGR